MDIIALLPPGYSVTFFVLAGIAAFGYAFQDSLMAHFGRKIDPYLVGAIRNLSFIITLVPLLFLAAPDSIVATLMHYKLLLISGASGAVGFACMLMAQRYFPIGIVATFDQTIQIWLLIWSALFFREIVPVLSYGAIALIIFGVVLLAMQNTHMPHLDSRRIIGFGYMLAFPFLISVTVFCMVIVARDTDPFAAAYFWEVFIGFFAAAIFLLRKYVWRKSLSQNHHSHVSAKDIGWISLISSGTLLGSGIMPVLMVIGSPGVAASIMAPLGVVSATLLSSFILHEHLKIGHWLAMLVVLCGVVLLKLSLP